MMKKTLVLVLAVLMLAGVLGACSSKSGDTVVVASKQYTENILLGEVYAQWIRQKTDLKVERKLNLGAPRSSCPPRSPVRSTFILNTPERSATKY